MSALDRLKKFAFNKETPQQEWTPKDASQDLEVGSLIGDDLDGLSSPQFMLPSSKNSAGQENHAKRLFTPISNAQDHIPVKRVNTGAVAQTTPTADAIDDTLGSLASSPSFLLSSSKSNVPASVVPSVTAAATTAVPVAMTPHAPRRSDLLAGLVSSSPVTPARSPYIPPPSLLPAAQSPAVQAPQKALTVGPTAAAAVTRTPAPRRIPGPAGALPPLRADDMLPTTDTPASAVSPGQRIAAAHVATTAASAAADTAAADFDKGPWRSLLAALNLPPPPAMPLQFNIAHIVKHGYARKVPFLVAVVRACAVASSGDAHVTLADPTGTLSATVHARALAAHPDLETGAAIILKKVSVCNPLPGVHHLIVTPDNIVRIYPASTPLPVYVPAASAAQADGEAPALLQAMMQQHDHSSDESDVSPGFVARAVGHLSAPSPQPPALVAPPRGIASRSPQQHQPLPQPPCVPLSRPQAVSMAVSLPAQRASMSAAAAVSTAIPAPPVVSAASVVTTAGAPVVTNVAAAATTAADSSAVFVTEDVDALLQGIDFPTDGDLF